MSTACLSPSSTRFAQGHPPQVRRALAPDRRTGPDPGAAHAIGLQAGDTAAFGAVYRAYFVPLCSLAKRYVRTWETAEELVQEVLLRVWEQRSGRPLRGQLRSYLYTAVRNQALDALKRERLERRWQERAVREQDTLLVRRTGEADDGLSVDELAATVERLVAALPPRCREAYVLRRHHDLSYHEIAEQMGIAPKTVEIQIGLALRALRRGLADWLPESGGRRGGTDGPRAPRSSAAPKV